MPNIGPLEIVVVLIIVLVIFGPKRLPGLGRSLGSGMREFKDSISGRGGTDDDDDEVDRPAIEQRAASTTVTEHRSSEEPVTEPRP